MTTFTKEQLIEHLRSRIEHRKGLIASIHIDRGYRDYLKLELRSSEIALASLEAEAVAYSLIFRNIDGVLNDYVNANTTFSTIEKAQAYGRGGNYVRQNDGSLQWVSDPSLDPVVVPLYSAPPAPVVNADPAAWEWFYYKQWNVTNDQERAKDVADGGVEVFPLYRRAAMLQGADTELQRKAAIHDALCEKYNVESLTDFVAWQRNHIAELEAAPPAPVGKGETAVMPDYPGYVMTQRECYRAGKKAGVAEAWSAPVMNDYPETLPCPVSLEPGLKLGKGVATKILLEALQSRANYSAEIEVIKEVCRDIKDGDFLAAAKINDSSEPVTTAYKLPKPIKDHRLNSGPDADDYYAGYQAGWNDSIGEAVICNSSVIPDCSTSAAQFVKDYCKSAGWTEQEFYETQVPMPDITSPSGWAAVSNSPLAIKSHVDLYMRTEPQQDALK